MLDYVLGRPSVRWRRTEVSAVIMLCLWCILSGSRRGPKVLWLRRMNRLLQRFSPWQIIAATLTGVYAFRHMDKLVGLHAPDPPVHLYSPAYSRAVWITMGLDAGFATAMSIRTKWLRDICSVLFSFYYFLHNDEADEKIRKFREVCTLDMLRATWDKTSNPYIRAITYFDRPRIAIRRKISLQRPANSKYTRPITAWLFFASPEEELQHMTDLTLDFPGGGFVAMGPTHHEERLRVWAVRTGKPVLSVEYSKAPEYPYPYAIEEGFDAYCVLSESGGRELGMSGHKLNVVISGDSSGGNIAVNVVFKILESTVPVPHPVGVALTYAALNFAFTSWSWPKDPRDLFSEHETRDGQSPGASEASRSRYPTLIEPHIGPHGHAQPAAKGNAKYQRDKKCPADLSEPLTAGVPYAHTHASLFEKQQDISRANSLAYPEYGKFCAPPNNAQLTMSSRAGYLNDRIITPSMMWAMAILYLGPRWEAGIEGDYHISPILAPLRLLAEFPPLLMQCGGKDPLVDDTMIFAGRVREAKSHLQNRATGQGIDTETDAEDRCVRMQIFPEWSHGYLQMPSIMGDARGAINDIADWITDAFRSTRPGRSTQPAGCQDGTPASGIFGRANGRSSSQSTIQKGNARSGPWRVSPDVIGKYDPGWSDLNGVKDVIKLTVEKSAEEHCLSAEGHSRREVD